MCCVRGRLQKGLSYGVDGEKRRQRPEFEALREETRRLNKIRINKSTAALIDEN